MTTPDVEAVRAIVARTRADQGLPAAIEDPVTLARVADIVRTDVDDRRAS